MKEPDDEVIELEEDKVVEDDNQTEVENNFIIEDDDSIGNYGEDSIYGEDDPRL